MGTLSIPVARDSVFPSRATFRIPPAGVHRAEAGVGQPPDRPRPLPHAGGSHSPGLTLLGTRPERPLRVATEAVCPGPGDRGGPAVGRIARWAGEGMRPRVPGAAGGGSSSGSRSSSSGGGHRGARGEAMVAAAARAHMPGAWPRAAASGAGCERAPSRESCVCRGRAEAAPGVATRQSARAGRGAGGSSSLDITGRARGPGRGWGGERAGRRRGRSGSPGRTHGTPRVNS